MSRIARTDSTIAQRVALFVIPLFVVALAAVTGSVFGGTIGSDPASAQTTQSVSHAPFLMPAGGTSEGGNTR